MARSAFVIRARISFRRPAPWLAPTLAALLASATPADAACRLPPFGAGTGLAGIDPTYLCYPQCVVQGAGGARVLRVVSHYDDEPFVDCRRLCNTTPGCVAVADQRNPTWDGRRWRVLHMCTLLSAGGITMADQPSPRPGEAAPAGYVQYVCVLQSPGRLPRWNEGVDTPKLHQDQFRPGVPGPSTIPQKP